jgi:hypothetical protein
VLEAVSEMAIRKVREHMPGRDNLSWGKFLQAAVTRRSLGEFVHATEPLAALPDLSKVPA